MKDMVRTGTKVGAALGGLAFVVFGIIPGYHFGSYGTLLMLKHLLGEAVEPTIFVRLAVAVGIVFGIACMASVCHRDGFDRGDDVRVCGEGLQRSDGDEEDRRGETVDGRPGKTDHPGSFGSPLPLSLQ
ncbi:MAG: hypothetical protein MZV70_44390 [Desulfobacterales bacterium]|nr:hypothetical protein [Desulfobacterales bacterium]